MLDFVYRRRTFSRNVNNNGMLKPRDVIILYRRVLLADSIYLFVFVRYEPGIDRYNIRNNSYGETEESRSTRRRTNGTGRYFEIYARYRRSCVVERRRNRCRLKKRVSRIKGKKDGATPVRSEASTLRNFIRTLSRAAQGDPGESTPRSRS